MSFNMPEILYPVQATAPVTTNGGVTCDYISLKNVNMAWIVVHLTQAVGHATAFTIEQATAVAGTGSTAITNVVPIWYGAVTTSSQVLARQTDAVSYTMSDAVTGGVYIIFQIDPRELDDGYDCITLKAADSSQATNFMEATYWLAPRYGGVTPPSFITD